MIPVYNMLKNEVESISDLSDLTDEQKQQLIDNVSKMDKTGHELLYVLIRSYDHEHTENAKANNTLPFNSRIQKTGIKFELDNMDIPLKHIIFKFSDMHLKCVMQKTAFNE